MPRLRKASYNDVIPYDRDTTMAGKFAILRRHRRIIKIGLAVVLVPVVAYGCFIGYILFAVNWPYMRADRVTLDTLPHVEEIARQIKGIAPADSVLVEESPPQAGTKHYALSASAPQYVTISTRLVYDTALDPDAFIAAYRNQFTQWGWDTLNLGDYSDTLSAVFRLPNNISFLFRVDESPRIDDSLVVGLCPSPDLATAPGVTRFVVFLDFDEGPFRCDGKPDRICAVALDYCEE